MKMILLVVWILDLPVFPAINTAKSVHIRIISADLPKADRISSLNRPQDIKKPNLKHPPLRKADKPPKQRKPKGIPKKTLEELHKAGAIVTKCPGENLYQIEMRFGDAAWEIFEAFAESAPDSPSVTVLYGPPEDVWNTTNAPPDSLMPEIVSEAESIKYQYCRLNVSALARGVVPSIDRSSSCQSRQWIPTPKLALSNMFKRIQVPDHPDYPVLTSLPSGSYICSILHIWKNAVILISVFKP